MNQAAAGGGEMVVCDLWDRCWCVLELAVRYLAEKKVACVYIVGVWGGGLEIES